MIRVIATEMISLSGYDDLTWFMDNRLNIMDYRFMLSEDLMS